MSRTVLLNFVNKLVCCLIVLKLSLIFNFTGNLIVILPVNSIPPTKNQLIENAPFKNRSSERVRLKKRSTAILIHCS